MQVDFPGFNNDARIAGTYFILPGLWKTLQELCVLSAKQGFKLQIGYFLEPYFYAANDKYALEI